MAETTRWKLERAAVSRLKDGETQTIKWSDITSPLAQAGILRLAVTNDPAIFQDGWNEFVASCAAALPYWITEANQDVITALVKLTGQKKADIEARLAALAPAAIDAIRQKPEVQAILNPVSLESLL
jgi:phage I-like protein